MYVIAGLGNPGNKYEGTRHNIGFEIIDYISRVYDIKVNRLGFKSLYGQGMIDGEKVLLIKPQTFMNLSGQAIKPALDFYKIPPENLFLICDDVNIPLGTLRIREKGSAGGHNGLKDIIYMLCSDEFPRLRVGVGAPQNEHIDLADHVLGMFSKEENEILLKVAKRITEALPVMMKDGVSKAMSRYNGKIE